MENILKYNSASQDLKSLNSMIPSQLAEDTNSALKKLKKALDGDVSGYVANRLNMTHEELYDCLATEQVDGVALAMYNIEKRAQSVIIGDQTGIGKGRQAAAMIRYGIIAGYIPVFFTDRYTLFSDMYRDCKALGIKDSKPLIVNAGVNVVDFDKLIEDDANDEEDEIIWSPARGAEEEENERSLEENDKEILKQYEKKYEKVYSAPKKKILDEIIAKGDIDEEAYDYLMITYSQLKDANRKRDRLDFLLSLCSKHKVLLILDEAHRSSSVSGGSVSVITQCVNAILEANQSTQCVFLSATFAKRSESLITFMRRTALSALTTESVLEEALKKGGIPMQEYVSTSLAAEGQMIRREHSNEGIPDPVYTYLDDLKGEHTEMFDRVMFSFRRIVQLSDLVKKASEILHLYKEEWKLYPARQQLFYINKVTLLSLKAETVAAAAVKEVQEGRCVVIGMSDTLECILRDITKEGDKVRGDISSLLLRLLENTVRQSSEEKSVAETAIYELEPMIDAPQDAAMFEDFQKQIKKQYQSIKEEIKKMVYHLPVSPIDVIRQLIVREKFTDKKGVERNIRFEECTGRAHTLEYFSPDGNDDYIKAKMKPRKKRHSNHIFNDFQNNHLDVILINACGAIGASAHAIATAEVPEEEVRQRKMLIVQNDLDVNIDLQKRGRINRTGQRMDLPPLYEYIISAIPSEKRLNMMLRAKMKSLSANTTACQDQDKRQADFIDISNKYGNQVVEEYLELHQDLAFALGVPKKTPASKFLAKIAMLGVEAQEDIVEEVFTLYSEKEAELRRLNQWDLEREHKDFEAKLVKEELFTTAVTDSNFGDCSYLGTYNCRQLIFPYDSKTLIEKVDKNKEGHWSCSKESRNALSKEITSYYTKEKKKIKKKYADRHFILTETLREDLHEHIIDNDIIDDFVSIAQRPAEDWMKGFNKKYPKHAKNTDIMRKLLTYSSDVCEMEEKQKASLDGAEEQKARLKDMLSNVVLGDIFYVGALYSEDEECPPDGNVYAVLMDVKFGSKPEKKFLPSNVEFVFALTAIRKEDRFNVVYKKSKECGYKRLDKIFNDCSFAGNVEKWKYTYADRFALTAKDWDEEIAKYNNVVVQRQIVTGNILGAYSHPSLDTAIPRFITFSLAPDANGEKKVCHGLLISQKAARELTKKLGMMTLPLASSIKFANKANTVYPISGLSINFSLMPIRDIVTGELFFDIRVDDKDTKKFEEDEKYNPIRQLFKTEPINSIYSTSVKKKPQKRYITSKVTFDSPVFQQIITHLSEMEAAIAIPREDIDDETLSKYDLSTATKKNDDWEAIDWKGKDAIITPPTRQKAVTHISKPENLISEPGEEVDEYSHIVALAKETLEFDGKVLSKPLLIKVRDMRSNWAGMRGASDKYLNWGVLRDINFILIPWFTNVMQGRDEAVKDGKIKITEAPMEMLKVLAAKEHLSEAGKLRLEFEKEYLFQSPEEERVAEFKKKCEKHPRLKDMVKMLDKYLSSKTSRILDYRD